LAAQSRTFSTHQNSTRRLTLAARITAQLEKAAVVEPVDPLEGGELERFEAAPGVAPMDHLGFVEAVYGSTKDAKRLLYRSLRPAQKWRSLLIATLALLFPAGFAACAEHRDVGAPAHPDLIIVRQFTTRGRIVVLDPSLGFSLSRGKPGVPSARRAASVARAAAFTLADAITQQLRELGYDVVQSDKVGPEPGGRALIVLGAFRSINEGHRRRFAATDASVAAAAAIDYQANGVRPQRLMAFQLDSRQTPHQDLLNARAHREPGVNSAAMRLGIMTARAVAGLAHRNNWPAAPR
jgi:hypothetical protein